MYDNDGGYWYYYVYDSYNLGYETTSQKATTPSTRAIIITTTTPADRGFVVHGILELRWHGQLTYGYVSGAGEYFGYYGYYEADHTDPSNSVYYYVAYNTNGDYYYGYTYEDTGTYSVGSYYNASVYDNDGGYWYYYVYDSYSLGYDTTYEGYDAVNTSYYYYDNDTGYGSVSYASYSSYGGMGSSYGYIASSGRSATTAIPNPAALDTHAPTWLAGSGGRGSARK